MKRLRAWFQKWLGCGELEQRINVLRADVDALRTELQSERNWRAEFTKSLKQKAAQPRIPVTDYESSQIAVLSEFKED